MLQEEIGSSCFRAGACFATRFQYFNDPRGTCKRWIAVHDAKALDPTKWLALE
jgi:hypothetical protein